MNKSIISLALTALIPLTACGGGNAIAETQVRVNPIPLNVSSFYEISGVSKSNTDRDNIFLDILDVGDVNGDGYDDILMGMFRKDFRHNSVPRSALPVLMIFNKDTGLYEYSEQFKSVASKHIWPRQGRIVDINNDGKKDIVITDTGVDQLAYTCGEQNSILINDGQGNFSNVSKQLPQISDYTHGIVIADFNNDGATDLLMMNSPFIFRSHNNHTKCPNYSSTQKYTDNSYMLLGSTWQKQDPKMAFWESSTEPVMNFAKVSRTSDRQSANHVGAAQDFNGDGIPDLAIGGNYYLRFAESNGVMSYDKSYTVPLPQKMKEQMAIFKSQGRCPYLYNNECFAPYSWVQFVDLDNDGVDEIVATVSYEFKGWFGNNFQALKRAEGKWVDITDSVFPGQDYTYTDQAAYCYKMRVADINGDGKPDFVCDTLSRSFNKQVMTSNGDGTYTEGVPSYLNSHKGNQRMTILKMGNEKYFFSTKGGLNDVMGYVTKIQ